MKNLVVSKINEGASFSKGIEASKSEGLPFISPDPDNDAVYLIDSGQVFRSGEDLENVYLGSIKLSDGDELIDVEFLPDQQALFAITKTGNFLLYNQGSNEVEQVGCVAGGLRAMCWSPDLELAALVTAQLDLILITADYEPAVQIPVFSEQFGDMAPVTVGWGRKETQFHGSAGKAAAAAAGRAQEAPPPACDPARHDDARPRVTWRGDGQMLAISAVSPDSGGRRFVVFARDGTRLSSSEPVPGLGQCLAWRPSGAILASVQHLPNKLQTVFFEKNGLRHGEFDLPLPPDAARVHELAWSADSAVLAVWLETVTSEGVSESRVQLWTTGNYHWYCKQEWRFAAPDAVTAVCWHPAADYRLLVLCRSGRLVSVSLQWRAAAPGPAAVAAVVDGRRVQVTPLACALVPPPMCSHELHLPAAVIAVCQGPGDRADWLWAVTADRRLHVFRLLPAGEDRPPSEVVRVAAGGGPGFSLRSPLHEYRGSCRVSGVPAAWSAWGWCLVTDGRLLCAAHTQDGYQLWSLRTAVPETPDAGDVTVTLSRSVPLSCAALDVVPVPDGSGNAVVHTEDGRLLTVSADSELPVPLTDPASGQDVRLPAPAQQMAVVCGNGRRCVLALTSQRRLYGNGRQLISGCTSFSVADDFLLVTTLEHTLRCLPLASLLDGGSSKSESLWSGVASRRLERGARLVAAAAADTRVVLQMPRGNLEVVHPRPLVVSRLARLMDSGEYGTACAEMRRHRINLNLLVDHAPETFADRCDAICTALRDKPDWLCVFISELSEEDVTQTLYRDWYGSRPAPVAAGKVDSVCRLVRESVERVDRAALLLPLITTLVRHTTPRLEDALRVINQLRESDDPSAGAVSADAALRYLICLVDVDELYSVALGTYDFDLVIMVAEKSQKDPKEYLPFLEELRQLPAELARFRIDSHLRRPAAALRHLVAAGDAHHQAALRFVAEHGLFTLALQLYPAGSAENKAVCGLYADHLDAAGDCWEAAAMFLRAGAQTSAVDALRRAGAWRDCLRAAQHIGMPGDQYKELCRSLAEELRAAGRCADAADIYERQLKQPEQQVACLLEGRLWAEAVQACYQARRTQLIALAVVPALRRAGAVTLDTISRIEETLAERRARLAAVRLHLSRRNNLATDAADLAGPDSDLYSDTSSVSGLSDVSASSASSSRMARSSKARRKQERKKYSLREGSALEDLALIAACHQLIAEAYALTDEVAALLRALVQHVLDEPAAEVQRRFAALLASLPAAAADVWPPETPPGAAGPADGEPAAAAAAAARLAQLEPFLRYPPAVNTATWKLKCLVRPAL